MVSPSLTKKKQKTQTNNLTPLPRPLPPNLVARIGCKKTKLKLETLLVFWYERDDNATKQPDCRNQAMNFSACNLALKLDR